MQWNKNDMEQYVNVTEYIDTLIIPLMPFALNGNNELKKIAFQGEVLNIFCNEIERSFKGRIFTLPNYTYILSENDSSEVHRINSWIENALNNPFKHIFLITFDSQWKKVESDLDGTLLWFPFIQNGDLQSEQTQSLIHDQIEQVTDLIKTYWNK